MPLTSFEKRFAWIMVAVLVLVLWRLGDAEPAMPKCNAQLTTQHERCHK